MRVSIKSIVRFEHQAMPICVYGGSWRGVGGGGDGEEEKWLKCKDGGP